MSYGTFALYRKGNDMILSPMKRKLLESYSWAIDTRHELTQQAIVSYWDEHKGGGNPSTRTIEYGKDAREISVYMVDLFVVEYLAGNNKSERKFEFVPYYQKPGNDDQWHKWKENIKTPRQRLGQLVREGQIESMPIPKPKAGKSRPKYRTL